MQFSCTIGWHNIVSYCKTWAICSWGPSLPRCCDLCARPQVLDMCRKSCQGKHKLWYPPGRADTLDVSDTAADNLFLSIDLPDEQCRGRQRCPHLRRSGTHCCCTHLWMDSAGNQRVERQQLLERFPITGARRRGSWTSCWKIWRLGCRRVTEALPRTLNTMI